MSRDARNRRQRDAGHHRKDEDDDDQLDDREACLLDPQPGSSPSASPHARHVPSNAKRPVRSSEGIGPLATSGSWAISVRDRDPVALRPAVAGSLPLSETRNGNVLRTVTIWAVTQRTRSAAAGSCRTLQPPNARPAGRPSAWLRPPVDQDLSDVAIVPQVLEPPGHPRRGQ